MKILSLMMLPVASVALLSNPAQQPVDQADVNAELDLPEVQAVAGQLHEARALIRGSDAPRAHGALAARSLEAIHERGLHTGHLSVASLDTATRLDSFGRGITPEGEWTAQFPRYAASLAR